MQKDNSIKLKYNLQCIINLTIMKYYYSQIVIKTGEHIRKNGRLFWDLLLNYIIVLIYTQILLFENLI